MVLLEEHCVKTVWLKKMMFSKRYFIVVGCELLRVGLLVLSCLLRLLDASPQFSFPSNSTRLLALQSRYSGLRSLSISSVGSDDSTAASSTQGQPECGKSVHRLVSKCRLRAFFGAFQLSMVASRHIGPPSCSSLPLFSSSTNS